MVDLGHVIKQVKINLIQNLKYCPQVPSFQACALNTAVALGSTTTPWLASPVVRVELFRDRLRPAWSPETIGQCAPEPDPTPCLEALQIQVIQQLIQFLTLLKGTKSLVCLCHWPFIDKNDYRERENPLVLD